jgi:hypothetical protein
VLRGVNKRGGCVVVGDVRGVETEQEISLEV